MFWIGAAAGVAVALLAVIVGISAIAWGLGKERTAAAQNSEKLLAYWQESLDLMREKNGYMERIMTAMESVTEEK